MDVMKLTKRMLTQNTQLVRAWHIVPFTMCRIHLYTILATAVIIWFFIVPIAE